MSDPDSSPLARTRREPPRFRKVEVLALQPLSPRMLRVTLGGPDLEGFVVDEPAASVRMLLPSAPGAELVLPAWTGNEFLLPDGQRPVIRTLTPLRVDPAALTFDVEIVLHGDGRASQWAMSAEPGTIAAVSGPGRGYAFDASADAFLVGGDETALPAISQLLPLLPTSATVAVHLEVAHPDARLPLPSHPQATIAWHDASADASPGAALVEAVLDVDVDNDTRIWVAGEAASVQRIRRHLFTDRGLRRKNTTIRGYWKHGHAGNDDGQS
jgi:NADPH-dependent ferric siderophore reductase